MKRPHHLVFAPFRLDLRNENLWRGEQPVPLRPKALAVLRYLAEHPQRLVTKEELLQAVWPSGYVSDGLLRSYIGELRGVLGDEAKAPRFIETANRRGYRFIVPVTVIPAAGSGADPIETLCPPGSAGHPWVGREAALARLQEHFRRVRSGTRQVVLITGDAGIGKTTLVNLFLAAAREDPDLRVLEGQCVESYGAGEAMLPLLEALSQGCKGPDGERLIAALRQSAPTWLLQLPWLVDREERETLQRQVFGATQRRLVSELCELLEALSAERPMVLVLEDLHWSDHATLDQLSVLARRRTPAQLLVLGTYRPLELILNNHPLQAVRQDLQVHRLSDQVPLELLSRENIADFLTRRFGVTMDGLAEWIYRRTDGHPLFMGNLVEYLIAQQKLVQANGRWVFRGHLDELERAVPENLKAMIEQQFAQLSPEHQRLLEVASLAGTEFSAALLAAALDTDLLTTEAACAELAGRRQLLRPAGVSEWPDGTIAGRYCFLHAFYPEVLHRCLPPALRMQLHRRLGERLESAYGTQAREIAAELALHFEAGRDAVRGIHYLRHAAETGTRRHAHREALGYLTRALELVRRLPAADRTTMHMRLLEQCGLVRRAMDDMSGAVTDFEALIAFAREHEQAEMELLAMIHLNQALFWLDRERSLEIVAEALQRSAAVRDAGLRAHVEANYAAWTLELRGWQDDEFQRFSKARGVICESGQADLRCEYTMHHTYLQFHRSHYVESYQSALEGMQLALGKGDAYQYFSCLLFAALAQLHRGEWGSARRLAIEGLDTAGTNELLYGLKFCHLTLAWLHLQTFAFGPARDHAQLGFEQARQSPYDNFATFLGLILLGMAHLGLGQLERTRDYLEEIQKRADAKPLALDWLLQMPLYQLQIEYGQAVRNLEQAQLAACRLGALAAPPGERTYLAHGHRLLAEISLQQERMQEAEGNIMQALAVIDGTPVPLAAWRVHATAAELYDRRGRSAEADAHWSRGATVIQTLADSLDEADTLRQTFLSAPPVQAVLSRTASRMD